MFVGFVDFIVERENLKELYAVIFDKMYGCLSQRYIDWSCLNFVCDQQNFAMFNVFYWEPIDFFIVG